jgi:surfactin synthase thioesterase subunit
MTSVLAPQVVARLGHSRAARARLLCFPQAGGGTAVFRPLAAALPPGIDLCALRFPGRESRRREEPIRRMDDLVAEVLAALGELDGLPVAMLGYCSGSFAAYQAARVLSGMARPAVARLFVLASPGPRVVLPQRQVHPLPGPDLIAYLRRARITPDSLLADPALFSIFEPAIRADFEVYETWEPGPAALDIPITVFGAREDDSVDLEDLLMWRARTTAEFSLRLLPGGHDFLGAATAQLGRAIAAELLPAGG